MKAKLFLSTLLLFAGMSNSLVHGQRMTINMKDGTKQDVELTTLKKLTFSNNNLLLNYTNAPFSSVAIPNIRKITIINSTDIAVNTDSSKNKMSIFMNPTDYQVSIKNAPESPTKANVYRIDGVLVLSAEISSSNNTLNASNLEKGLYLLKINNQVFKFKK